MTYEVLSTSKAGGQLEFMRHVVCAHDLVGPFSIYLVLFVDLEPSSAGTSVGGSIVNGLQEVCDWARVARLIPLDLDGVASGGVDCLDSCAGRRRDVASHVVALDIGHRAVGWWHPDADLVARSLIVDPELVQVLVSRDGGDESGSEDCFGVHLDVWKDCMRVVDDMYN
jgi:hypothetical protein